MVTKGKGIKTKEKIIDIAKKEFYENGYRNALIQTIADKANISLGNFTYYYTKDDIVREIYGEFVTRLHDYVEQHCDYSVIEKFCCSVSAAYYIIFTNEKNRRFFHELIQNESTYRIHHELIREYYLKVFESLNIELSKDDLDIVILSQFGSRREIFLSYFTGELNIPFRQLLFYFTYIDCGYFGITKEVANDIFKKCENFIEQNDFSQIKYLI